MDPKGNHRCPYKRKAVRNLTPEEGSVTMEAEGEKVK